MSEVSNLGGIIFLGIAETAKNASKDYDGGTNLFGLHSYTNKIEF